MTLYTQRSCSQSKHIRSLDAGHGHGQEDGGKQPGAPGGARPAGVSVAELGVADTVLFLPLLRNLALLAVAHSGVGAVVCVGKF